MVGTHSPEALNHAIQPIGAVRPLHASHKVRVAVTILAGSSWLSCCWRQYHHHPLHSTPSPFNLPLYLVGQRALDLAQPDDSCVSGGADMLVQNKLLPFSGSTPGSNRSHDADRTDDSTADPHLVLTPSYHGLARFKARVDLESCLTSRPHVRQLEVAQRSYTYGCYLLFALHVR